MLDFGPPIGRRTEDLPAMSIPSDHLEKTPRGSLETLPMSLSVGVSRCRYPDLTIHRQTETHHGRALRTLGHAAEYLVDSRRLSLGPFDSCAEREAVHILMRMSREIFGEYATLTSPRHPVTDWIMNKAIRAYGAA